MYAWYPYFGVVRFLFFLSVNSWFIAINLNLACDRSLPWVGLLSVVCLNEFARDHAENGRETVYGLINHYDILIYGRMNVSKWINEKVLENYNIISSTQLRIWS